MGFHPVRYLGKLGLMAGANGVLGSCERQTRAVLLIGPIVCLHGTATSAPRHVRI